MNAPLTRLGFAACAAAAPLAHATTTAPTPAPTTPAPAAASAFAAFEAYAGLVRSLAAKPGAEAELAFVQSCRPRLLRLVDRTPSTRELLTTFEHRFDPTKVAPETAVVAMALLKQLNDDADLPGSAALFGKLHPVALRRPTPIVEALALAACARFADRNIFAPVDGMSARERLLARLSADIGSDWLKDDEPLKLELLSIFNQPPGRFLGVEPERRNAEAVRKFIHGLPPERRTYAIHLTLGREEIITAWRQRGSDWAHRTTPAQFAGFETHLKRAGEHLRLAHAMQPDRVAAAYSLMTVAMANPEAAGGTVAFWMKLAQNSRDFNESTYTRFADANAPRWSGNPGTLLDIYARLINDEDYDSLRPYSAIEVLDVLIRDTREPELLAKLNKERAAAILNLTRDYLARNRATGRPLVHPSGEPVDFRAWARRQLRTHRQYAHLAELDKVAPATPQERAREHRVDPVIRDHFAAALPDPKLPDRIFPKTPMLHAAELTDACIRDNREAQRAHNDRDTLAEYDRLLAAIDPATLVPEHAEYLADLRAMLAIEQRFLAGESVAIPLRANLWSVQTGRWSFDESAATGSQLVPRERYQRATCLGRFAPPYTLSMRVRCGMHLGHSRVGFTIGTYCQDSDPKRPAGRCFVMKNGTSGAFVLPPWANPFHHCLIKKDYQGVGTDYTLTLRVLEHGYAFAVNNGPVMARRDDTFDAGRIGIGNMPFYEGFGEFTYSDLRIRRLKPEELSRDEAAWMNDAPASAR